MLSQYALSFFWWWGPTFLSSCLSLWVCLVLVSNRFLLYHSYGYVASADWWLSDSWEILTQHHLLLPLPLRSAMLTYPYGKAKLCWEFGVIPPEKQGSRIKMQVPDYQYSFLRECRCLMAINKLQCINNQNVVASSWFWCGWLCLKR